MNLRSKLWGPEAVNERSRGHTYREVRPLNLPKRDPFSVHMCRYLYEWDPHEVPLSVNEESPRVVITRGRFVS